MLYPQPRRTFLSAAALGAVFATAGVLTACAVGPDYVRPTLDVPAVYKEAGPWKPAEPQAVDSRRAWWEAYGDPTLNALVVAANGANQNIRQAEAQYREAEATAAVARAGLAPTLGVNLGGSRSRIDSPTIHLGNGVSTSVGASWEPDLWGGVRRAIEAGEAGAAASADDLAAARLSIQTTLAQDYLQLRFIDMQRDLYASTNAAYAKALELTQAQYKAGVVLRSDVALAEAQLKGTQAQAVDLEAQRSQFEHAIAILTGQPPANYTLPALAPDHYHARLPAIPSALPSELLERRPDIAAAERRAAVANANIGVARAAFFPSLTLSASAGYASSAFGSLFETPSRVWSLGVTLAQTVFDGGLRRAHSDQAVAAFDVAVAQYKQTVLGGFQQVEDNLATLAVLDRETLLQDQAVTASRLAEQLALNQYRGGTATYLSVITAQTLALTNQRTAVQLRSRQLVASVALVTATGGGWDAATPVATAPATPSETPAVLARPATPATTTTPATLATSAPLPAATPASTSSGS